MKSMFLVKISTLILLLLPNLLQAACELQTDKAYEKSQSPKDLVQSTTDLLLEDINKNRQKYKDDPNCLYETIDKLLGPTMDFERFTARVMGKYFRTASKDQHQRFISVVKSNALQTYANSLLEFEGYTAKVTEEEISQDERQKTQKAKVDMNIITADGSTYPISYSMTLNKQNQWLVQNVIVNGINLGLTLRNQFSQAMQDHNNDIGKVIDNWETDLGDLSNQ